MSPGEDTLVTPLLKRLAEGDATAHHELVDQLYPVLKRIARGYMRGEQAGHTLQPTALVHEAYVRLLHLSHLNFENRAHFLGVIGHLMRQVLIDHARAKKTGKRGGGIPRVPLDDSLGIPGAEPSILDLEDALCDLERRSPLEAKLIEMRFFSGMTAEESAAATGLGVPEVRKHLRLAQAWLQRELDRQAGKA